MKKGLIYLFAALLAVSFTSCVDNTPAGAERIAKQDLIDGKVTGFQWFADAYEEYDEKVANFEELKTSINGEHSFILIGKPACSCDNYDAESLAAITKILDSLKVEERYELLIASSYKAAHPFEDKLTINDLPAYFILKNDEAVYSIYDSLLKYSSLPDSLQKDLEDYILEGLKK